MNPLFTLALVFLAAGMLGAWFAPRFWLVATLASAATAGTGAVSLLGGGSDRDWTCGWGPGIHLRLDGLSAFFLILLCVVGAAGTLYSSEYWTDRAHPRSARTGRIWWSGLLLSMAMVLFSANGLHFLIAWEMFTVCAYFLITLDRQRGVVRAAGWLYLATSHASTLVLFAFFSILAVHTGSWELGSFQNRPELGALFWLALFAFGLKAGLFPLHIWLPAAHANAPSHVSAMLSGMALKLGIYGIVRFSGWLPVPSGAGWAVAALGGVSAVLGVAFALGQHDLKRLLAYHSVENIGIILLGVGFGLVALDHGHPMWGFLAMAGGLLHVWNHGLFKALLFLGAGSVLHATGTREMSRLGGLWRAMPWTTGLFALGAVAICGLPPLNGFVSEWLVYSGLFEDVASRGNLAWPAVAAVLALGVTGALALACFTKVCGIVFLGAPRTARAAQAHECGTPMRGAMLLLAAPCVAIGLAPVVFWPSLARAVSAWNPSWSPAKMPESLPPIGMFHSVLVALALLAAWSFWSLACRRGLTPAVTWDCGCAAPTARMQYTAGSFASTITGWFAWILRPARHECRPEAILPDRALFEEHTPETVLDHLVGPVAGAVMNTARWARQFQHGRVQAYLLYLIIGLSALAGIVLAGGAK